MARVNLKETGTGFIPLPGRFQLDEEGKLGPTQLSAINAYLDLIARTMNNLSLGNGVHASRAGNLNAQILEFVSHGTPDTQMAIDHGLKRVPVGYIPIRKTAASILYDANIGGWGKETIYLKCDTASVLYSILLF